METIKLNNGLECPVIGIGTYQLSPADAENSVREALKIQNVECLLQLSHLFLNSLFPLREHLISLME